MIVSGMLCISVPSQLFWTLFRLPAVAMLLTLPTAEKIPIIIQLHTVPTIILSNGHLPKMEKKTANKEGKIKRQKKIERSFEMLLFMCLNILITSVFYSAPPAPQLRSLHPYSHCLFPLTNACTETQ